MNDTLIDSPSRKAIIARKIGGWVIIALSFVYLFNGVTLYADRVESSADGPIWFSIHFAITTAIAMGGAHLIDRSNPTPPLTNKTKRRIGGIYLMIIGFIYLGSARYLYPATVFHTIIATIIFCVGILLLVPIKRK